MSAPPGEIRIPRQRRSQETFDKVLRAGRLILEEEGIEGFTVQAVSKRAGVSVGSIYLRAPSREALLLAIHDEEMARMQRDEASLFEGTRALPATRDHIEAIVAETARMILSNSKILRAFMRRGPEDPEIWQRARVSSQVLADRFENALLDHRAAITHADPETAVDFAFRMVYSMTSRRMTHGEDFESVRPLADEAYIAELSRAVGRYLCSS